MPAPSALSMLDNARRLGRHRWVCDTMFELLGTHATSAAAVPSAKAPILATHGHHLAWHAQLIAARLPALTEFDPATFTVAPSAAVEAAVATARAARTTDELIASVYGVVLPQLLIDCQAHLDEIDPRVDGPTARLLTLMIRDLQADIHEATAASGR